MSNIIKYIKKHMGKIIAILNHKGGVAKTTTTVNLGAALALEGKKVLLIDLDPQTNLTNSLGFLPEIDAGTKRTICEALESPKKKSLPIYNYKENIDVVLSSIELASTEVKLYGITAREQLLSWLLKPVRDKYDYILIDCPPSLNMLPQNAMTAADGIIIPVETEYLALQGMKYLIEVIELVRERLNERLTITGYLCTKYDSRKTMHQVTLEKVRNNYGGLVFNTIIRTNVDLSDCSSQGKDIFSYNMNCNGAVDYRSLAKEFLNRV